MLTNDHVIVGSDSLTVTLFGQTTALPAHVLGTDPSDDLALIQIDHAANLPTVTFADSSRTRVGDAVLAIGNALALAGGPSVTEGIVSAENRSLTAANDDGQTENLTGLIQTDAAINPGQFRRAIGRLGWRGGRHEHRGGLGHQRQRPDPEHRVRHHRRLGQAAAGQVAAGGTGGAGSPAPELNPAANSAYIGVTVGPVTPALRQTDHLTPSSGALIVSVEPGSPAQRAALHVDDVIVSFNGTSIQSPDDLTAAIHPLKPGAHVTSVSTGAAAS